MVNVLAPVLLSAGAKGASKIGTHILVNVGAALVAYGANTGIDKMKAKNSDPAADDTKENKIGRIVRKSAIEGAFLGAAVVACKAIDKAIDSSSLA